MKPPPDLVLEARETVHEALQSINNSRAQAFLVRLSPAGWTSITRELLQRFDSEGKAEMTVGSVLPMGRLPFLHPDYPLEMALRYVEQTALVPVVSRADFRKLEGVISSADVLAKYRGASLDPRS